MNDQSLHRLEGFLHGTLIVREGEYAKEAGLAPEQTQFIQEPVKLLLERFAAPRSLSLTAISKPIGSPPSLIRQLVGPESTMRVSRF